MSMNENDMQSLEPFSQARVHENTSFLVAPS